MLRRPVRPRTGSKNDAVTVAKDENHILSTPVQDYEISRSKDDYQPVTDVGQILTRRDDFSVWSVIG